MFFCTVVLPFEREINYCEPALCRYVDDGRPFWQYIVTSSTGCSDDQYFEELYNYFMTEKVGEDIYLVTLSFLY